MDLLATGGGGPFQQGDCVWEIVASGLYLLQGVEYVLDVNIDGMLLSRQPGGDPLTDIHDHPCRFSPDKFEKVFLAA